MADERAKFAPAYASSTKVPAASIHTIIWYIDWQTVHITHSDELRREENIREENIISKWDTVAMRTKKGQNAYCAGL